MHRMWSSAAASLPRLAAVDSTDDSVGGADVAPSTGATASDAGDRALARGEQGTVLVVEDDRSNLESLERLFAKEGYAVLTAPDARTALDLMRKQRVHVVLTDLMMPGISGMDLLKGIKATSTPETEVVLMTAFGTVETAVEAMKEGAYDFVAKPLKRMQVTPPSPRRSKKPGSSPRTARSSEQLADAARSAKSSAPRPADAAVLDDRRRRPRRRRHGAAPRRESAPAKSCSRGSHQRSRARAGRFVAVNCAAIPESLLEAELFGYEKGAFTGATQRREGRFDASQGGHALPRRDRRDEAPSVQVKLLRVLQDGEYEPLGGTETLMADVRLVAATNRDIEREVVAGALSRRPVLSPQRDRRDVSPRCASAPATWPLLAQHFFGCSRREERQGALHRHAPAIEKLGSYRGRATCASSRTRWSARWCSRRARRSRSLTCLGRSPSTSARARRSWCPWARPSKRSSGR
jgi:CheY-like chemotaxis protein